MNQDRFNLAELRKSPPTTLFEATSLIFDLADEVARLRAIAFTDGLTKLLKREPVMDRLSRELRVAQSGNVGKRAPRNAGIESVAVVSIDLIGFKAINDAHGHSAGDGILMQAAKAFTDAVRTNDIVARWGGDEFMLVLWNISPADVDMVLERVQANMRIMKSDVDVRIGCVIWSKGSSPVSAQHLIDAADRNERILHAQKLRGSLVTICGIE